MNLGLSSSQALDKLQEFGRNEIAVKKKHTTLSLLFSQFPTIINGILLIAAIFSLYVGDRFDAFFIFTILLLNSLFGFIQEYQAEKALEKLQTFAAPKTRVKRNGKEEEIDATYLVPGDIVVLTEGDRIPADGKLMETKHLEIDESILTGESLPLIKQTNDLIYSGTLVVRGRGIFMVATTGMKTRLGEVVKTLADVAPDPTPLQRQLTKLGNLLSLFALFVAFSLVPIGFLRDQPLLPMLLLAASIGVAAIPEGLPAIITIALAMGTSRMAKKKAIVRRMQAVETLGSVQVLLIDKTGTFTQNSMEVKHVWHQDENALNDMVSAASCGNTATLVAKTDHGTSEVIGDKTDGALLLWATRQKNAIACDVIDEYTFDPDTKTITTVVKQARNTIVYVRGAPEIIIRNSTLIKAGRKKVIEMYEKIAKDGLRIIAFGKKIKTKADTSRKSLEHDLTFLGFVGLYDPPRVEAKEYIKRAQEAGIQTVMVTGDNELTALAIGKEVGLVHENEDIMTGETLKKLSDSQLEEVLLRIRIFARTRPEDKLRLVEAYKKQGFIVGVTGDGVNDALALKRADVGIAMGAKGTDVAKEASDIVLTDDNFASIMHAVYEGRIIYANITKTITYLLSGNLSELALVFFATLLGFPSPLLPTQILWINIVTDGLPALALASDRSNTHEGREKPRDPEVSFFTRARIRFILFVGLGLAGVLLSLFIFLSSHVSPQVARIVVFNGLVFSHMIIAFVLKKGEILENKLLAIGVIFTIILQILISTLPPLQKIFHLGG